MNAKWKKIMKKIREAKTDASLAFWQGELRNLIDQIVVNTTTPGMTVREAQRTVLAVKEDL